MKLYVVVETHKDALYVVQVGLIKPNEQVGLIKPNMEVFEAEVPDHLPVKKAVGTALYGLAMARKQNVYFVGLISVVWRPTPEMVWAK